MYGLLDIDAKTAMAQRICIDLLGSNAVATDKTEYGTRIEERCGFHHITRQHLGEELFECDLQFSAGPQMSNWEGPRDDQLKTIKNSSLRC